jgi:hypothetical protein
MRFLGRLIFCISVLVSTECVAELRTSIFFTDQKPPQDSADFGTLYGSINYSIDKPYHIENGRSVPYEAADRALASGIGGIGKFLRNFIGGTETTSYLLTIEVTYPGAGPDNKDLVFTEPFLAISSKIDSFLFMELSRKTLTSIKDSRTIVDWIPIRAETNRVQVAIKAERVAQENIDLAAIRKIFDARNKATTLTQLAITGAAKDVTDLIQGIASTLFDRSENQLTENSTEMSFIQVGGSGKPSSLTANIRVDDAPELSESGRPTGRKVQVIIPIKVAFLRELTRLEAHIQSDNFTGPIPKAVIEQTKLRKGSQVSLMSALRTSDNEIVRKFLDALYRDGQYKTAQGSTAQAQAGSACQELYGTIGKYLTQRDQAGYYCAFLNRFYVELSKSDAPTQCLDTQTKREMSTHGIEITGELANLVCTGKVIPVKPPVAFGTGATGGFGTGFEAVGSVPIIRLQ